MKSSLFIPVDEEDNIQEIDLEFQNNRFIKYRSKRFFQDCMGEDRDYILKQMEKFIERSDILKAYLNILRNQWKLYFREL